MNLYETIVFEMADDDEDTNKISVKLYNKYYEASADKQEILDEFLIALVGWSMSSLLERRDELK